MKPGLRAGLSLSAARPFSSTLLGLVDDCAGRGPPGRPAWAQEEEAEPDSDCSGRVDNPHFLVGSLMWDFSPNPSETGWKTTTSPPPFSGAGSQEDGDGHQSQPRSPGSSACMLPERRALPRGVGPVESLCPKMTVLREPQPFVTMIPNWMAPAGAGRWP